jgi:hypothetical protein
MMWVCRDFLRWTGNKALKDEQRIVDKRGVKGLLLLLSLLPSLALFSCTYYTETYAQYAVEYLTQMSKPAFFRLALVAAACLFSSCAEAGYKMSTGGTRYVPVLAQHVEILFSPPSRPYKQIGIVSISAVS